MARRPTLDFLKTERGAGLILALAAAAAVIAANSPSAWRYFALVRTEIPIRLGAFAETRSLAAWVRDGLMTVFFLVLGMQIKFEVLRGELSNPRRLALPAAAAIGGAVVPVLIYIACNLGGGGAAQGWPAALPTDTAVALAVLAMAAPRLPPALRILVMTVALADDLAAVAVSAALSADRLHPAALAGAVITLAALAVTSWWRRAPFLIYAAGFVLVWAFTLESGVSPSVAGVLCAFTVPIGARRVGQDSTLKFFMDSLHPYVAFAILPLFAFTAAGVSLRAAPAAALLAAPSLGVALALVVGKPLGIFGAAALAAALRLGRRPIGTTWGELAAVAMLGGVGLTLGLFIAGAVPTTAAAGADLRAGVMIGSLVAALASALALRLAERARAERDEED